MRGAGGIATTVAAVIALGSHVALGDVVSNFDAGTESWTAKTFKNLSPGNFTLVGTPATSWVSSGGASDGYLRWNDVDGDYSVFSAPAAFLGNRSAATALDYSIMNTSSSGAAAYSGAIDVVLVSGSTRLVWTPSPTISPGTSWTSVTVSFSPSSQWEVGDQNGAQATASDFASVLANLTGLYIRSEYTIGGTEFSGLDSVRLVESSASVVPLPPASAMAFGTLGLLGVLRLWRRRG